MTHPRLRVRTRLLLTIVGALALGLAAALAAFWLLLGQRLSTSATSLARAQAEAEAAAVQVRGGALVAVGPPASGVSPSQTWVFAGTRAVETPRASRELQDAAQSLAGGPRRALDVRGEARLYAVPVVRNGTRYGTVVSAASLDAYEETTRATLVAAVVLVFVVLGIVAALAWWVLGRVLRPVSQMTENAAEWSEHDLDRRFALGEPYDELTRLAATLDSLLERIAASLRHERRFASELSHELRTPLARLSAETELALRRDRTPEEYRAALCSVQENAVQMTRTVEALVAASRREASRTIETSDVRDAVAAVTAAAGAARPSLSCTAELPSGPVRVAAEAKLVAAMLQPLADNAVRYARSTVTVVVQQVGSSARVLVADDGPGVADDERDRIFEPGARGRAGSEGATGAGLGLPLARRLARSAGGEVRVDPCAEGGRFTLTLPLAG